MKKLFNIISARHQSPRRLPQFAGAQPLHSLTSFARSSGRLRRCSTLGAHHRFLFELSTKCRRLKMWLIVTLWVVLFHRTTQNLLNKIIIVKLWLVLSRFLCSIYFTGDAWQNAAACLRFLMNEGGRLWQDTKKQYWLLQSSLLL